MSAFRILECLCGNRSTNSDAFSLLCFTQNELEADDCYFEPNFCWEMASNSRALTGFFKMNSTPTSRALNFKPSVIFFEVNMVLKFINSSEFTVFNFVVITFSYDLFFKINKKRTVA